MRLIKWLETPNDEPKRVVDCVCIHRTGVNKCEQILSAEQILMQYSCFLGSLPESCT